MKAANASKLHTQAKNLAQARLEAMRDMQFHVDRQNGPFVDMLDVFYTDLTTSATTRVRGSETMVGKYIASGASSPEPSGAFYQVKVAQLPANSRFSQTIDTQFLNTAGSPMPPSSLAGYDSQVEGKDAPPSLMVGVTVITSWSDHGTTHSYSTYTRMTESRGTAQLLSTQGTAEFLRLASATPGGSPITVDVGLAQADGSTTTGSSATATDKGVYGTDGSGTSLLGAYGLATSPSAGGSV